ncbi:2,3,4,5-tetrahydropyridine-2,6-dicarboxylate N-acetyltransferase [Dissulfuribacter thermophilus]|uniref:2,3,4,5-tetrahydropyridine-2,6-dicarboxylate N-acetyltransferase n=1 Tax=Dissulfuribacter thermophilus TaxID=1156395 RepID=A0A1B9F7I1_9BACT|nr:Gfo/Idh/MocA family oxidoreductase [Dissulfuribacter thermophilus]OCC15872.1 2,3,4,5-tetrahydropyridine-2,6-dicarboxylate N-acetyltransferase [Dissulfuribacter thermophilus]
MRNQVKVALIGAGYWGKNLVRNFHALDVLSAVVDPNPAVQQWLNRKYPEIKVYNAISQVLGNPQIDAMAIATPAETHGTLVREGILAGKDVYVEKPLCLSEKEGEELINLAETHERILMVGHLLWYHSALLKLQNLIGEGQLGRILYVYSNRLNMGKLRREENVLWSFAPHDVSVILGLLNEFPDEIQAHCGNYLHQNIADVTVSLLSFPSGIKAHIFVSWLHPFKEQKLVIVGEQKMAVFDDTQPWEKKLILYPHKVEWKGQIPAAIKAEGEYIKIPEYEPLRAECEHFIDCITSRSVPRTDGKEGLRVLKVLNACQKAIETGYPVKLRLNKDGNNSIFIHPTAIVDEGAIIGNGTKIWHFSHVLGESEIGPNCNIGQNVVIGPRVRIGKGCKIQNNVSVYEGVTLEDYVFCGPSVVFTNVYNPRAEIPRKTEFRSTLVKKGASLGANSTILCGITIGEYAFIGAGSVVTKDVPPHALVVGNPARQIGWVCKCGNRLDKKGECKSCGIKYSKDSLENKLKNNKKSYFKT